MGAGAIPNTWLCESTCPAGYYGYLVDRICYTPAQMIAQGITTIFGDPISKTYIYPCRTTPSIYFGDPTTGTCVTVCPNVTSGATTTYYYGDPSTRNCELTCQNAAYSADPSTNLCQIQCSFGVFHAEWLDPRHFWDLRHTVYSGLCRFLDEDLCGHLSGTGGHFWLLQFFEFG
jgi:hypothetical protein